MSFPKHKCANRAAVEAIYGKSTIVRKLDGAAGRAIKVGLFGDPELNGFEKDHLTNIKVPGNWAGGKKEISLQVNKALAGLFQAVFTEIDKLNLGYELTNSGTYVFRYSTPRMKILSKRSEYAGVTGGDLRSAYAQSDRKNGRFGDVVNYVDAKGKSRSAIKRNWLSEHSYGTAIDLNYPTNPMGAEYQFDMPKQIIEIFAKYGFDWGGYYHDYTHFEYMLDHVVGAATPPVAPPGSNPPSTPATSKPTPAPKASTPASTTPKAGGGSGIPELSFDSLLQFANTAGNVLVDQWNGYWSAREEASIDTAYDAVMEERGYFPIGLNMTWHGGMHLFQCTSDPTVRAMLEGVVVAARLPEKDPAQPHYGSRNFVLVKHKTPSGKPFWSLYMHLCPVLLQPENVNFANAFPWLMKMSLKRTGAGGTNLRDSPDTEHGDVIRETEPGEEFDVYYQKAVGSQKWLQVKSKKDGATGWVALLASKFEFKQEIENLADLKAGKVVKLNKPIRNNECLGFYPRAASHPKGKPFIHWEVFSDQLVSNKWTQCRDEDNDIVCDNESFKKLLNKGQDVWMFDQLTPEDIAQAYRDPKLIKEMWNRAYYFQSEWSVDWKTALKKLDDDFEVDKLAPRLQVYNFWKDAEALGCDLPKGGKVWHYDPCVFITKEFPIPAAIPEPVPPAETAQNGNFTIIDKKAVVRETSPPHKSTTETIPYFSKITVNSVSGEFATVQIGGAGAMKVTKKTNYVAFIKDDPRFQNVGLAPSVPVAIESGWSSSKKLTASTYNRLGGLLKAISDALGLEVAAAIAVWRVESGGKAHTPNQAIIRFENHHFWNFWGKNNAAQFDKSFTFGGHGTTTGKSYQGHKVSKDGGTTWSDFHGDQTKEYDVLNYASTFDKEAARKSISIGGCQIMISNHAICGYKTASEMYDAFQASEKSHVLGFFDFCKFCSGWHSGNDTMFNFAKAKDWVSFASKYNGPSNKDTYGALIETAYNEAKDVLP